MVIAQKKLIIWPTIVSWVRRCSRYGCDPKINVFYEWLESFTQVSCKKQLSKCCIEIHKYHKETTFVYMSGI